jgi:hypothetical protein
VIHAFNQASIALADTFIIGAKSAWSVVTTGHALNAEQVSKEESAEDAHAPTPTPAPASPEVHPSEVKGKTPTEIDKTATDKGLIPKGPDPKAGKGSYVDPVTGEQRVLVHPDDGHAHVNNPAGERLGPDGSVVPKKSPEAHIPIKKDTP